MKAARDLFIEEDVSHRLHHLGIEPDRELTDIAGAIVGVEDIIDSLGIVGGGLDNFAIFKLEANIVEGSSLVN